MVQESDVQEQENVYKSTYTDATWIGGYTYKYNCHPLSFTPFLNLLQVLTNLVGTFLLLINHVAANHSMEERNEIPWYTANICFLCGNPN